MTIASIAPAMTPVFGVIVEGLIVLIRLLKRALKHCPIVRLGWRIRRRIAPLKRRLIVLSWALTIKLVARLSPLAARYPTPAELGGTHGHFHIVGIQYYRGTTKPGETVSLVRQPNNKYDSNAIAVHNPRGEKVGFIARDAAPTLARIMDKGARIYGKVLRKVNPYRILIEVLEE